MNISLKLVMTNSDDTLYKNERAKTPEVDVYDSSFDALRPHISHFTQSGVRVLISTGRNATQVSYITGKAGMNGLCICEMGQTVFVPSTDGSDFTKGRYLDTDLRTYKLNGGGLLHLPRNLRVTEHFNGFSYPAVQGHYSQYDRALEEVWRLTERVNVDRLREQFGDPTLRYLHERKNIVTFEMDAKSGEEFRQMLLFGNCDFLTEAARKLIAEGSLITLASKGALDIQPPVTKETTARHVMNVYGVSPEEACYVGDSDHSDGPVISIVKYGAAVSNSDEALKIRVAAKRENGFISQNPYTEGTIEILSRFKKLVE